MDSSWTSLSACELGRQIGQGAIDPRELASAYFECIRESAEPYDIYVRLTEPRAHAEAEAAAKRAAAGRRLSNLDGVPISWKDNFDTAGVGTEGGTLLLKGRVPKNDAEAVRRATAAGLVCLGKTHLSEIAFSGLGLNPVMATPRCVNDPEAVAGGSSSGAAVSVARGLAAAGIGSDTGGSVRIPSAFNDLVGLKTTLGLIPLDGVIPLCRSFDTIGPLARTVEDAAALLAVFSQLPHPPDLAGGRIDKMKFMVLEEALEDVREEPLQGFNLAVEAIRCAGGDIETRSLDSVASALTLSACLYGVEAAAQWYERASANSDLMYSQIWLRVKSGKAFLGMDFVRSWIQLHELRESYRASTSGFDAVLLPSGALLPPKIDKLLSDDEYHMRENILALRNTRIANLMEVPALTIPTGVPSTGIMLFGRPFDEASLLRIGSEIERLL